MGHIKFSRIIKDKLLDLEISQTDLAYLLGTSKQGLNNKMRNDVFNKKDMDKIADALNCDLKIQFIDRDNNLEQTREMIIQEVDRIKAETENTEPDAE